MAAIGDNEPGISADEEEWVRHTLMEADRKRSIAKVLQVDCKAAVPPGNHYVSDIYRLKLKVMTGGGTIEDRSVIYKTIPKSNEFKLPNIKELGLFKIEATVYTDLLSQMKILLTKTDSGSETLWPEFYGVKGAYDGCLLEDLSVYGYKMADRLKGLDLEHSSLALRSLAKFHALGAVLLDNGIAQKKGFLSTCLFFHSEERTKKFQETMTDNFANTLENRWKGEWVKYAETLRRFPDYVPKDIMELLKPDENTLQTINHGDCWLNNILFKYDTSGFPQSIKFVDYQMAYCNSPIFDIHYFLSTSLRYDILHRKVELLRVYYDSLVTYLKSYDYGRSVPSFEKMRDLYERTKKFALGVALTLGIHMRSPGVEEIQERFNGGKPLQKEEKNSLLFLNDDEHFVKSLQWVLLEAKENGFL